MLKKKLQVEDLVIFFFHIESVSVIRSADDSWVSLVLGSYGLACCNI